MATKRHLISSFNGGEISRRMEGRVDLDGIYDRATATMFNYVATVEGPAIKRPGFRFIKAAAASSTWLSRFVFNTTQAYVLEWGNGLIRFYTNGGQIETSPGVPYEVAVPYTAAAAPRVSIYQSFDRLYMAHANHPPASLLRTGATTFVYAPLQLRNGPFKSTNGDKSVTVYVDAAVEAGSSTNVHASANIFLPGHVGAPFLMEATDYSTVPAWEPGLDGVTVGNLRRSDGKIYAADSGDGTIRTGTVQPTHVEGIAYDGAGAGVDINGDAAGGISWRYVCDRFGVGTITAVISPTEATIDVTRSLPPMVSGSGTYLWAHGCFSAAEGWPNLVTEWGGRLIFIKGVEIIGSVIGDYENFAPFTSGGLFTADMAFRRSLSINDPPLWVHPDKDYMLLGSASQELVVGALNTNAVLSGDNYSALPQSSYGSAPVWPQAIGTAALFAQRGGRKIREAEYTFERGRFVGVNINVWARQVTRSGIRWLAFQQEPEEMLWCGRADGVLAAHPHSPEQQVKGFSRVQLAAGTVLAGVTIPSDDGTLDDLWVLAELDGFKGVLRLDPWWDEDAAADDDESRFEQLKTAFFLDWGVSYDGAPRATFTTGLSHLEGRDVRILADGEQVDGLKVIGGSLTLPRASGTVHIGLGYQARLQLLRPEFRGVGESGGQGLRQRIVKIFARLIDSSSPLFRDARARLTALFDRLLNAPMDRPAPLFNGFTGSIPVGAGNTYEDHAEIISDDALPSIVSMLVSTYEVEDAL